MEEIIKRFLKDNKEANRADFIDFYYFINFTKYVEKTVRETRKSYFIKEKKYKEIINIKKQNVSIQQDSYHIKVDELPLEFDDKIYNSALYDSLHKLSHKQREVIINYYVHNKTEAEISIERQISKQAVNNLRKRGLVFLREMMGVS